jgi:hypothetical protein
MAKINGIYAGRARYSGARNMKNPKLRIAVNLSQMQQ